MSIRKRFNEIFRETDSVEDERKRFVERVNQAVFHHVDTEVSYFNYPELFQDVCLELGVNAHGFQHGRRVGRDVLPPELRDLTHDDLSTTLKVLCAMYKHIRWDNNVDEGQDWLSQEIEKLLSYCTCDIGVKWAHDFFYPSGADELDRSLIEEVLTWLKDYPNEEKDYRAALRHYMAGESLPDVVKNCYSAVEGVVQTILKNKKNLGDNKDALLAQIGLSSGWKALLAKYIDYAHDYRHARNEKRHDVTSQEAEAYLYMTGLIIRLTIESKGS